MDDNTGPTQQQGRTLRRPQPIISCLTCKRMKLKCDRHLPCERCVKNGRASTCAFAPGQKPSADSTNNANANKRQRTELISSTADPEAVSANFVDLQERVQQLERALRAERAPLFTATQAPFGQPGHVDGFELSSTPHPCLSDPVDGHHPNQMLGHPVATQFEAVHSFTDALGRNQVPEEVQQIATDIHSLHHAVKRNEMPLQDTFHIYDDVQDVLAHLERLLPAPNACTTLIQLYFHNFENCTRVLHRGTAWSCFRAYLNDSLIPGSRHVCLPLLAAVVSIASSLGTLPECDNSRLHGQDDGIGAYQLLRNYLNLMKTEQWNDLTTIRLAVLTLKYQKSCPLSDIESWQWSGDILRRAMAAGLHITHTRKENVFESEMKRRLWLSILEFDLTFAIASDMPANCPTWQSGLPLNVNDEMIWPGITERPQGRGVEEWTDGTCQHVLAQSFNERLAAYSLVSSGTIASYSTILEHTRHLEHVIHDLPQIFRLASMAEDASDSPPHRLLAKMEMDFLLRRPLNACYAPYAAEMSLDDRYKEARILWIQGTSFSICFQDLFDPKYPSLDLPQPEGLWDYFYNVYSWDVHRYFLANCLELQRLRTIHADAPDVVSPAYQGHSLRTSVKVAGWNIEGITKSLEDTINPLARRIGRHGSSLRELVQWTAVVGALRVSPTCSRRHAIKNELQGLLAFLKHRRQDLTESEQESMDKAGLTRDGPAALKWLQRYLRGANEGEELDNRS